MSLRRLYLRVVTHNIFKQHLGGGGGTLSFKLLMFSLNVLKSPKFPISGGGGSSDNCFLGGGGGGSSVIPTFDGDGNPKFPISGEGPGKGGEKGP